MVETGDYMGAVYGPESFHKALLRRMLAENRGAEMKAPTSPGVGRVEFTREEMVEEFTEPDVDAALHDKIRDVVPEGARIRGSVLHEAVRTINGERQDVYGAPEDSFALIGEYWGTYLRSKGYTVPGHDVQKEDVAMMMSLFKIAREANQHKRDNIVDSAGYQGIYADMMGEK